MKKFLRAVNRYLIFFTLVAFLVTCCLMLFVSLLSNSLDITLTGENLEAAAKITFVNVLLLSFVYTLIDAIRRKITVERTAKRIADAAKKLVDGDFSVRIPRFSTFGMEESFHEIAESFNRMAEELSGVETLRTDFISNVSHEMKTPLSVISNYASLLRESGLSEEKRMEYAGCIHENARRLSDMMVNILKLNKLENQQIFPAAEHYDLGEQLCEALLQYERVWEEKNIEIETDIEDECMVRTDRELLSLVFSNLLSNAFKFTPEGGKVSMFLKTEGKYACVQIRDTGVGMSKEVGAHIFEKFYQGDRSHATRGNGLGLALVKRVMDIVKGEITVESEMGKGSAFTVRISKEG